MSRVGPSVMLTAGEVRVLARALRGELAGEPVYVWRTRTSPDEAPGWLHDPERSAAVAATDALGQVVLVATQRAPA